MSLKLVGDDQTQNSYNEQRQLIHTDVALQYEIEEVVFCPLVECFAPPKPLLWTECKNMRHITGLLKFVIFRFLLETDLVGTLNISLPLPASISAFHCMRCALCFLFVVKIFLREQHNLVGNTYCQDHRQGWSSSISSTRRFLK